MNICIFEEKSLEKHFLQQKIFNFKDETKTHERHFSRRRSSSSKQIC